MFKWNRKIDLNEAVPIKKILRIINKDNDNSK